MSYAWAMGPTVWARRLSLFVVGLSAVAVGGWVFDLPVLTSLIPGSPGVTRLEAALAFTLLAAGVWGATVSRGWAQRFGVVATCLGGAIGAEALLARGSEGLQALHSALPPSPTGVRMASIPTAVGMVLASLSLLLARAQRRSLSYCFDRLTLATVVMGGLGVLSVLYGWYEAFALWAFRTTSLLSGLALLGLGLSVACLRPERGIGRAMLDPSPAGMLMRRLLPAAVALLTGLGFHERIVERRGLFSGFGSAPFVFAQIAGVCWFVSRSARSVRRLHAERELAQKALQDEMRAHTELLMERELRFRLLAETAPQIVWSASADGGLEYLSPTWAVYTGESEELARGWAWRKYIHPLDVERVERAWRRSVERGERYECEYRARRHDGVYRCFLSRAISVCDTEGRVMRWYGADTDVHELREAREALRQNEARFRLALQHPDFITWTQDAQLRYNWVYNPAPGFEATRSLGKTDLELLDPENGARLTEIKQRVLHTAQPFSGEVPLVLQGTQCYFEMRINPLIDIDGGTVGLAGAAYDITSRKRSEEAVRNAQKLESVGQLAAGVAHDFNNLLTGIIGNASFALSALPKDAPARARDLLERVIASADSAAVLTRQLLAYAGKGRFHVEPIDLRKLKDSSYDLLRASVPRAIELDFDVPSKLPLIQADLSQLQQLLTNLLLNAVEAIGDGHGCVAMKMRALELDREAARSLDIPEPSGGPYVQIEVKDDGPGMPQTTLERAFEPFFSTKFIGRGLGLSAAQGIARAHGGGIVAHSQTGRGTQIVVTLPALRDGEPESEPPSRVREDVASESFEGAGVLFVDDERIVRDVGRLTLSRAGYRVWLAENGAQALEVVREHGHALDVIVLDMTMPVMGGAEAAQQLRQQRVDIPIVASSGYSETETLERFGDTAPMYLRKPYRPAELLTMVASAIGRARKH